MGFKMKGSAFKLGTVQGTNNHASALKDTNPHTGKNPDHEAHKTEETKVNPDQKRADELRIQLQKAMKEGDQATIDKIRAELYQMYLKSKESK